MGDPEPAVNDTDKYLPSWPVGCPRNERHDSISNTSRLISFGVMGLIVARLCAAIKGTEVSVTVIIAPSLYLEAALYHMYDL